MAVVFDAVGVVLGLIINHLLCTGMFAIFFFFFDGGCLQLGWVVKLKEIGESWTILRI